MRKIILEEEYCMKHDLLNVKIFQKNSLFHPEMILRPLFCFKVRKNTGLLIFNSLKQKELIFNFLVNSNWKKLADSRKRAEILADNRKSHHPIEVLFRGWLGKKYGDRKICQTRWSRQPRQIQILDFTVSQLL